MFTEKVTPLEGDLISSINDLRLKNGIKGSREIFVNIPSRIGSDPEFNSMRKTIIENCNVYSGDLADGLYSDGVTEDITVDVYPF